MNQQHCQIINVGHTPEKLKYSIDKEVINKLIFIIENEPISGIEAAEKALKHLRDYYDMRKMVNETVKFDFHIQAKPIAQLVHLICQQKLQGFKDVSVNVSGGLRYITIWFYIACCITQTEVIHGDFIYEGNEEVGIIKNMNLVTIPIPSLTDKQFEFLKLFFEYQEPADFFSIEQSYNENSILKNPVLYNSLEDLRENLSEKRGESVSRGVINGFLSKLKEISAIKAFPNPENGKEKSVKITHMGIALFLDILYKKNLKI